tara:strand:+ start:406 stop:828 length:423 start_codon:yes stop_codon:yes gene_type:complete
MIKFLFIILDFFNFITTADDFKGVLGALAGLFGFSKLWDLWQKRNDNETKVRQAKIEAEKEIKSNNDKHTAEIEKLKTTIQHQKGEIKYKDSLIKKAEDNTKDYKLKAENLLKLNEEKDKQITHMHERLLECEKSKNRKK